jgi:hypothetical protein
MRQHLDLVTVSIGTYSQRCIGPTLPSTAIEYPETSAYCKGNLVDTSVRHAVQLGIYCPGFDTAAFFYNSYFLECGKISTQFDYIGDVSGHYSRFTCYESAIFAENSNQSVAQSVPALSIGTDKVWEQSANDLSCFTRTEPKSDAAATATMTMRNVGWSCLVLFGWLGVFLV